MAGGEDRGRNMSLVITNGLCNCFPMYYVWEYSCMIPQIDGIICVNTCQFLSGTGSGFVTDPMVILSLCDCEYWPFVQFYISVGMHKCLLSLL